MGFYKFHCKKCNHEVEGMCNADEFDDQICGDVDYYGRPKFWFDDKDCTPLKEGCGNTMERVWQPISFHIAAKGMDTHGVHNINGHYSQAFGRYFKNEYAKEEWAEQNGYKKVSESEADARLGQQYEDLKKQDKVADTWTDNLKASGGDKVAAAAKTFVPTNMQDKK